MVNPPQKNSANWETRLQLHRQKNCSGGQLFYIEEYVYKIIILRCPNITTDNLVNAVRQAAPHRTPPHVLFGELPFVIVRQLGHIVTEPVVHTVHPLVVPQSGAGLAAHAPVSRYRTTTQTRQIERELCQRTTPDTC